METIHLIRGLAFTMLFSLSQVFYCSAQTSYNLWEKNFYEALKRGDIKGINSFFAEGLGQQETDSWKYELERGYLNFNEATIIRLDTNAVMLHIPTNNTPYNGDNHDEYFDFIYRVYRLENRSGEYLLAGRIMDDVKPDFIDYKAGINVNPAASSFFFKCDITLALQSPHLLFRLAKDFEITDFKLNGKEAGYKRFGYIVCCFADTIGKCQLYICGSLKSPQTQNQFISMNSNAFFIRPGGFAAIPSPPQDNSGRNFFSDDSTHFDITYTYPGEFTLLQYGDPHETTLINGQKQTKTSITGTWMDEIAFYACKDWEIREIVYGNTEIGFYFNKKDNKERDYIISEVDTLLQWLNKKFNDFGIFKINFVVLDNFVTGGLLNDSHSIIARNAEIIGSGGIGYLHEICHSAPQPSVHGNYLWIKEGFTNFLSYEYLYSEKGEEKTWDDLKRKYLHCFELYREPLVNIRSTSIPSYWAAYSKASWVYRMLESETGKDNFREALFRLATLDDIELKDIRSYFEIFEQVSGKKLAGFEEQWINRKENPVLTVQGQLEKDGIKSLVRIRILQKEPYFTLPLEVEIKTESDIRREVILVSGKETVFKLPVKGNTVSINYDPDSRLFAIIKNNKKTFTDGLSDITLPEDTAVYFMPGREKKMQVWYTRTEKGIKIFKKDEYHESSLELTNILSPVSYMIDGDTIFKQDTERQIITVNDKQYDIAEPIYPGEFIPFLFSMSDWNDTSEQSLLYLIPGSLSCQVIHCKLERRSEEGYEFVLKELLSDNRTVFRSKNGIPESFITTEGNMVLLERK